MSSAARILRVRARIEVGKVQREVFFLQCAHPRRAQFQTLPDFQSKVTQPLEICREVIYRLLPCVSRDDTIFECEKLKR